MGNLIDLLAFLDGWDYREISGTIAVEPNVINEVFAEKITGWLIAAAFDATDAFTNLNVSMPPETFSIVTFNLADLAAAGLIMPIAQSFILTAFNFTGLPGDSSGFGAAQFNLQYPIALKKDNTIHIQFTLDPGTTQLAAGVDYVMDFIQITQPNVFKKSYLNAIKGNLTGI